MNMPADPVEELARGLTKAARDFLLSIAITDWWRTDEGQRVPQSLLTLSLIERAKTSGFDFTLYRITPAGLALRNHLQQHPGSDQGEGL
jgi:hypothetical protein